MPPLDAKGSLFAGVLTAIGASVCCVGPLVLMTLGVSGAWISSLTALEPVRPVFAALTAVFLGLAFRRIYLRRPVCAPRSQCAEPKVVARQRKTFWIVAAMVLALLSAPTLAPLFY
jgi:mercuric ion transport protein